MLFLITIKPCNVFAFVVSSGIVSWEAREIWYWEWAQCTFHTQIVSNRLQSTSTPNQPSVVCPTNLRWHDRSSGTCPSLSCPAFPRWRSEPFSVNPKWNPNPLLGFAWLAGWLGVVLDLKFGSLSTTLEKTSVHVRSLSLATPEQIGHKNRPPMVEANHWAHPLSLYLSAVCLRETSISKSIFHQIRAAHRGPRTDSNH